MRGIREGSRRLELLELLAVTCRLGLALERVSRLEVLFGDWVEERLDFTATLENIGLILERLDRQV